MTLRLLKDTSLKGWNIYHARKEVTLNYLEIHQNFIVRYDTYYCLHIMVLSKQFIDIPRGTYCALLQVGFYFMM